MILTKKNKEFIEFVKNECKKHGVKAKLNPVKYVKISNKLRCGGYFDSDNKILATAMGHKDSMYILVHEYCHLTQWLDKIQLWTDAEISLEKVDEWLNGKNVKNILKHLKVNRDLELDNEIRSVKLIKEYGLDIDVKQYIKKANAYILFYNHLYNTRKWSKPDNSPYVNEKIVNAMPNKFVDDYDKLYEKFSHLYFSEKI